MLKKVLYILLLFSFSTTLMASHIVGGRIYYECLGDNTYKIILKIYRDCYNGEAPFDRPANVSIYNRTNNQLFDELDMSKLTIKQVPVIINDPCLSAPPNVCVEEGVYEAIIQLPPSDKGYLLAYQRCCRNKTIANLINPNEQGATYFTVIPQVGGLSCNNSPVFTEWPPIAICADKKFNYDYSATDPDGDSLAYKFCAPLKGATIDDPIPSTPKAPPYEKVSFYTSRGFSAQYPVSSSPALKIDPETGIITGKPTVEGQYVVGVCVEEYKDGVLIGTEIRDFQFNVTACQKEVDAKISIPYPDTSINNCKNYRIDFTNLSQGTNNFIWDFGIENRTDDVSSQKNPSFTYPDTGTYRVSLIAEPGGVCADTDFVTVKIYPLLDADFAVENTCPQDSVPLNDLSDNTYGAIDKWEWNFGDGNRTDERNPTYRYQSDGTYDIELVVTNKYGCKDSHTERVKIYPKPNTLFSLDQYCLDKPVVFDYRSWISNGEIIVHEWTFGTSPTQFDTAQIPNFTFTTPGTYKVQLVETSDLGCTDTFSREIEVRPVTDAKVNADTSVCATYPIQLSASGGFYYRWEPEGGYLQNINNPYVHPEETTTYTVYVSDGCYDDSATVTVETKKLPYLRVSNDTSILKGGTALLAARSNADKFEWSPKDFIDFPFSASSQTRPPSTTTYQVKATGKNGCIKKGNVTVEVLPDCHKIYIPNAFSPNGDGINDYFYPTNAGEAQIIEFSIYNRWGMRVFTSDSPEQAWNGTLAGERLGSDTYVYSILLSCSGREYRMNGNVLLLR